MAQVAVPFFIFMVVSWASGPGPLTVSTTIDDSAVVQDANETVVDEGPRTPRVWITSRSTLEALQRASRGHALEPELPIKVIGAHVGFRYVELDTASVLCKSMDRKAGCWVVRLELMDASGSLFWSISTYDTAFTYLRSLLVEERRASASPKTMFLIGQITYYDENYPLDYQIRVFDPTDSLTGHPDTYDAKGVLGYAICKDGSIRCCPIPANCFHRKVEMKMIVPASCQGC